MCPLKHCLLKMSGGNTVDDEMLTWAQETSSDVDHPFMGARWGLGGATSKPTPGFAQEFAIFFLQKPPQHVHK